MASLIKKKKGNRLYYYLVESARVDGQPRIVHQAYLGTAEKLAELIQQRSAPVPLAATVRDLDCPAPCGSPPSNAASGPCCSPSGPLPAPDPAPPTIPPRPPLT